MGRVSRSAVVILALSGGSGCATVRPDISVVLPGDVNPDREAALLKAYEARTAAPPHESHVKVLDAAMLNVSPFPVEGRRLLGKVHLEASGLPLMMSVWWFTNYQAGWRKAYCYPQVVLTWATSLLWSFLPPAYPCWTNSAGGVTKKQLVQDLRSLAEVMGGNLVVANFGTLDTSDSEAVSTVDADVFQTDHVDLPKAMSSRAPADPWIALLRQ